MCGKLSTNFSKDSHRSLTSVRCLHRHMYLPTSNTYLHTRAYTHTYLHTNVLKIFTKTFLYAHIFQHIHSPTRAHKHTHLATNILHTNSIRPALRAGRLRKNFTITVPLNLFQKICYKVLLGNVAPSRGPRLCRP